MIQLKGVYMSNIVKARQNGQKVSKLKGFKVFKGLFFAIIGSLLLHLVDFPIRFLRYFVIQGFGFNIVLARYPSYQVPFF